MDLSEAASVTTLTITPSVMKTVFRTQIIRTSLVKMWITDLLGAATVTTLTIMPLAMKTQDISC